MCFFVKWHKSKIHFFWVDFKCNCVPHLKCSAAAAADTHRRQGRVSFFWISSQSLITFFFFSRFVSCHLQALASEPLLLSASKAHWGSEWDIGLHKYTNTVDGCDVTKWNYKKYDSSLCRCPVHTHLPQNAHSFFSLTMIPSDPPLKHKKKKEETWSLHVRHT